MPNIKYKRVLLKLSGEALSAGQGHGINTKFVQEVGLALKEIVSLGVELAIVVGGGNFWRGRDSQKMDRVIADQIGMLATMMNALALSDALDQAGVDNRVMSSIEMRQISELYIRKRAVRHLEKGRVIIFACGTGNPYFSTDSAAALRAAEISADILLKATNVEGVYNKDPRKFSDAKLYEKITHDEVLQANLQVMDATAAALCRDNSITISVFNMEDLANIKRIIIGEKIGTLVCK